MGSKSKSSSTPTTNNRTDTTTTNTVTDARDFSDRSSVEVNDNSIDRRAVLSDSQQILDSVLVNIDPSDESLRTIVLAWERQATALIEARRFDNAAATELLNDIVTAAENGLIAVTDAHYQQLQSWQAQLQAGIDFATASLATGERLVQSAGERQRSVTDRVFDLAVGSIGQSTTGQIKLVGVTLLGIGIILFAARKRA